MNILCDCIQVLGLDLQRYARPGTWSCCVSPPPSYQWLWILGFPLLKSTIHYLVLLTLWAKVLLWHHSFRLSISLRYSDSLLPNIQPTTVVSSANLKDGNGVMSCYSHVYRVEQGTKHTASSIWWLMRRTFCKLVVIGVCWWGSQGRRGTQYSKFW